MSNVEKIKDILLNEASPKIEGLSVTGVAEKICADVKDKSEDEVLVEIRKILEFYIYPKNSLISVAAHIFRTLTDKETDEARKFRIKSLIEKLRFELNNPEDGEEVSIGR